MFMVRIKEKGGEDQMLPFDKEEVSIGRGKGNDIILPKGNVSKRHARIVHRDGKFIVVDLRSTNGTYFNARKISSPVIVTPQDKIYIGDFVIRVLPGGPEAAAEYKSEPSIEIGPPAGAAGAEFEPPAHEAGEPEFAPEFAEEAAAPEWTPPSAVEPPPAEPVIELATEDEEIFEPTRAFESVETSAEVSAEVEVPIEVEEPHAEPIPGETYDYRDEGEQAWQEEVAIEPVGTATRPAAAHLRETIREPEVEPEAVPLAAQGVGEGLLRSLMDDPEVQEVTAVAADRVFVTRGGERARHPEGWADAGAWKREVDAIVRRLGADPATAPPFLEGLLQAGILVRVLSPPLVAGGRVCQVHKTPERGATMAVLQRAGVVDAESAAALTDLVRTGRSVLVVGPPRSGRTTLLNALAHFLPESALFVLAEERPEMRLPHAGIIRLQIDVSVEAQRDLLRRLRQLGADAIVIGSLPARMLPVFVETAHEAATLVLAAATGRDLDRFLQHTLALCQAPGGPIPSTGAVGIVAEALDVLVLMERGPSGGYRVGRIAAVEETDGGLGLRTIYGS